MNITSITTIDSTPAPVLVPHHVSVVNDFTTASRTVLFKELTAAEWLLISTLPVTALFILGAITLLCLAQPS